MKAAHVTAVTIISSLARVLAVDNASSSSSVRPSTANPIGSSLQLAPAVCDDTNWEDYQDEIRLINISKTFSQDASLLRELSTRFKAASIDPIVYPVTAATIDNVGYTFNLTLTGVAFEFSREAAALSVTATNASGPTGIEFKGSLDANIVISANITVEFVRDSIIILGQRLCRSWPYWIRCQPDQIHLQAKTLPLTRLAFHGRADVHMQKCGVTWFNKALCRIISSWEFLKNVAAVVVQRTSLYKRITRADIDLVDVMLGGGLVLHDLVPLIQNEVDASHVESKVLNSAVLYATQVITDVPGGSYSSKALHDALEAVLGDIGKKAGNTEIERISRKFGFGSCAASH